MTMNPGEFVSVDAKWGSMPVRLIEPGVCRSCPHLTGLWWGETASRKRVLVDMDRTPKTLHFASCPDAKKYRIKAAK